MSRDDLLQVNGRIMKEVITQAIIHSPQARYIVVTNPLDVMTDLAWRVSGLPAQQVMGMAGVLDTARFCTFIAMELGVPVEDVSALVLGGHGDLMVPLSGCASVSGIPLRQLLDQETINRLIERTQYGGAEIVELLKTGGAYQAPAAAVYQMVEAILLNRHRILPIATYLTGQYGLFDVFLGVPAQLGWLGVESVMEVVLTDEERAALHQSALIVKSHMEKIAHCWQPPTQLMLS
jgi:malate dehydrogenase